jgi:hypothetical protein
MAEERGACGRFRRVVRPEDFGASSHGSVVDGTGVDGVIVTGGVITASVGGVSHPYNNERSLR